MATQTRTRSAGPLPATTPTPRLSLAIALFASAGIVGALIPNLASGDVGRMTHYMGLLAANQPWNLILFMAIPVILAETLAVTELVWLFRQGELSPTVRRLHRGAGLIAGPWFFAITIHLLINAVAPLTTGMGWHGPADYIAVLAYLAGIVPLGAITLIELGVLGRGSQRERMKLHATFVGVFLIVAHVAMIFGMLDPTVLGWQSGHLMPDGSTMPGMGM